MKKIILTGVVLLNSILCLSQDAKAYYELINKGQNHLIENDLSSSLISYGNAFELFNYPFYKHIKQAALVALFNDNEKLLKKYLTKCVEKGMLRNELQYFINKDKSNVSKNILLEYGQLRSLFLESIDSTMLHHFMELDMLDSYSNPLSYKNDNESLETHRRQQVKIMNSYVNLIDSLGYPSESNVGHARIYYKLENETGCRWEDCFKYFMKYYNDIHFSDENLTVITAEEKSGRKLESVRPGNSFIWHYHGGVRNDSSLLRVLNAGFEKLKVAPSNIIVYYESLQELKHDFCGTYVSKTYTEEARSKSGRYHLSDTIKKTINKNRLKYYILPLEMEEQLIMSLYKIEHGKSIKKVNEKSLKKIDCLYYTFISLN